MTIKEVTEKLENNNVYPDQVCLKNGVFTVKWGYYYHNGRTPDKYCAQIIRVFPLVTIVESGDHFGSFKGGKSVSANSHFFVKFKP